jgi:hypothetical protein
MLARSEAGRLLGPILRQAMAQEEPRLDPRRSAELLGLSLGELAAAAGVDRNTVTRNPGNHRVQALLGRWLNLVERAGVLAGDPNRAIVWFRHQPIEAYDFKTPLELAREGHTDAILAYLDDLDHGTYA